MWGEGNKWRITKMNHVEEVDVSKVRVGQMVSYPVGRGYGSGKVTGVEGDYASIETAAGKTLSRRLANLKKAGKSAPSADRDETQVI